MNQISYRWHNKKNKNEQWLRVMSIDVEVSRIFAKPWRRLYLDLCILHLFIHRHFLLYNLNMSIAYVISRTAIESLINVARPYKIERVKGNFFSKSRFRFSFSFVSFFPYGFRMYEWNLCTTLSFGSIKLAFQLLYTIFLFMNVGFEFIVTFAIL